MRKEKIASLDICVNYTTIHCDRQCGKKGQAKVEITIMGKKQILIFFKEFIMMCVFP